MSWRDHVRETADTAIGFARVTASALGAASSLVLDIILAEDDDDEGETQTEAEVYGEAALLFRPADPDADGAPEAVVMRHGDERIVIATKDRRWQVELEKGDVCVRAMGENAPRLFLRADGTVTLEGATVNVEADTVIVDSGDIRLGGEGPLGAMALASPANQRLNELTLAVNALVTGTPVPNDGGLALQTAVKVFWPSAKTSVDVGASKVTGE